MIKYQGTLRVSNVLNTRSNTFLAIVEAVHASKNYYYTMWLAKVCSVYTPYLFLEVLNIVEITLHLASYSKTIYTLLVGNSCAVRV